MARLAADFEVEMGDSLTEFHVLLPGPRDTLYEGGLWRVRVELPPDYPYKSPSIGFTNKIYHPNIDDHSGSVCLDVINQTWSPMFSVFNVFDTFLPQLLGYPNAADPLNGAASSLYNGDRALYEKTVREYVREYANEDAVRGVAAGKSPADSTSSTTPTSAAGVHHISSVSRVGAHGVPEGTPAGAHRAPGVSRDQLDAEHSDSDVEADVIGTLRAKRRQSSVHSRGSRGSVGRVEVELDVLESDSDMDL